MENNDNKESNILYPISSFSMLANSRQILSPHSLSQKLAKWQVSLLEERGRKKQGCSIIVRKDARKQKAHAADTQQISKKGTILAPLLLVNRELMWHFTRQRCSVWLTGLKCSSTSSCTKMNIHFQANMQAQSWYKKNLKCSLLGSYLRWDSS